MTPPAVAGSPVVPVEPPDPAPAERWGSWWPSAGLVRAKLLEQRRRTGLMVVVVLLTLGLPVIVLGIRLLFHAVDPGSYGPAGTPSVFTALCEPMAEFGFVAGAVLGASAGTTDLGDGVFRHLVITGRSRVALYLARIPAGLAVLVLLVAVGFSSQCLVTAYAGTPNPASVEFRGVAVPTQLDRGQLEHWLVDHPAVVGALAGPDRSAATDPAAVRALVPQLMDRIEPAYQEVQAGLFNPSAGEMTKIGLWMLLDVVVGFLVALGLGSLLGQRTVATVLMIVLELVLTPLLVVTTIPYFLNGQRLFVGVAIDQLRPAGLLSGVASTHHRVALGGRGSLGIPAMPTWAMVAVIVGWVVVWTVVGAWRMATRDA